MASSTHHHQLPLPTPYPYATTTAPPPTPSANPHDSINPSHVPTPDTLSHLLHRLPPSLSLSLPSRRPSRLSSSNNSTIIPPLISLSDPSPSLLSASTEHGFFHLSHHSIPSHLPLSAESTSLSLFNLPQDRKQLLFPCNWPLGYDVNDDDDKLTYYTPEYETKDTDILAASRDDVVESFCFDSSMMTMDGSGDQELGSLHELGREMEKLGLRVVHELASAVGFENPTRDQLSCLFWVSDHGTSRPGRVGKVGRVYPYGVGLHYVMSCRKYSLSTDSGRVEVSGQADSVLVTLGDIAQVWSNGRFKKVRGRPVPSLADETDSRCITMSLLVTLPVESTVSPLIPNLAITKVEEQENEEDTGDSTTTSTGSSGEKRLFYSFSFEDYAWRVYHERLLFKDPLARYHVSD